MERKPINFKFIDFHYDCATKTGDILKVFQKIKEVEYDKIWLVIFCEENIAKGYQSYKVICLDSEINITNEYGDTTYSILVKMVSALFFSKRLFFFSSNKRIS